MILRLHRYNEVVQKALEFMRSRPDGHTTVAAVAAHVAYSPAHLRRIFKAVTGQGVLPHLNNVCIEKAKHLLRQTTLEVSEVAYAAGFENPSNFARLFRRNTGTSPSVFRRTLPDSSKIVPVQTAPTYVKTTNNVVRDDFTSEHLADWWTPTAGVWTPQNGHVHGTSQTELSLRLATPLPENFRMEFDLQIVATHYIRFRLHLLDTEGSTIYCEIAFHHPNHIPGVVRLGTRNLLWSTDAVIEPGVWRTVRLEMNDNRITVFLNGKRVFAFRDIFPPSYSRRCRFAFVCYENTINLRHFRLQDLGFLPVISSIRQGDALYNAGLFGPAKEFYLRHLRVNLPPEEEMELRFKIGMCLLRQNHPGLCRDWMHSSMPLAKDPFWRRESDLVLLQLEAGGGQIDDFTRHATESSHDSVLLDGIRPILSDYYYRMRSAGFYDRALQLAELSVKLEKNDTDMAWRAKNRVTNVLKHMKRFTEATRVLRLINRPSQPGSIRVDALISMYDICLMQHNIAGARRMIAKFTKLTARHDALAQRDYHEAECLRAEWRFKDAVALFIAIRTRHANPIPWPHISELRAAEILCCLGKIKTAQSLVKRIQQERSEQSFPGDEIFDDFVLVSYLAEKRYAELATILLHNVRRPDDQLFVRGQKAVSAGIMLELAGNHKEAHNVWHETHRRFPPERCYFWGTLARNLATENPDGLETIPLPSQVRAQMLFLTGLLFEKRGQTDYAQRLFALSIEDDPTMRWPAHLALLKTDAYVTDTPVKNNASNQHAPANGALDGKRIRIANTAASGKTKGQTRHSHAVRL